MRGRLRTVVGAVALMMVLGGICVPASAESPTSVTPAEVIADYTPGTVMTGYGPVDVSERPQRVVTLSEYALDTAVSVGVTPVGAIATAEDDGVAAYIADDVPDVTIVGRADEVDVAAVKSLEPDLILASWQTDEELYTALSEIAPTIVPPSIEEGTFSDLRGWEYDVLVYAHALGEAEAAAESLQEMHDRAEAMQAGVAQAVTGQAAVVVQWTEDGPVVLSPEEFSSVQLYRAGFSPVEDVPNGPLRVEELAQLDADWLFIVLEDVGRIPVIEGMTVVMVDRAVWASSAGPIAANLVLDDIENAVEELSHS